LSSQTDAYCLFFYFFIQVSDVDKILGIVQTENLQLVAEAYDIDLEITPGTNRENTNI